MILLVDPQDVSKVWPEIFEESSRNVNKEETEQRQNGSDLECWVFFEETLNICGELVRKVVHLWAVGAGCKIGH